MCLAVLRVRTHSVARYSMPCKYGTDYSTVHTARALSTVLQYTVHGYCWALVPIVYGYLPWG